MECLSQGVPWYVVSSQLPLCMVIHDYSDGKMSAMASHITGVSIVCSAVCSGTDQRKHQSSAALAFVRLRRKHGLLKTKNMMTQTLPFSTYVKPLLLTLPCSPQTLPCPIAWASRRMVKLDKSLLSLPPGMFGNAFTQQKRTLKLLEPLTLVWKTFISMRTWLNIERI